MRRLVFLIVLISSSLLTSVGQSARIDPEATLKQLLAMPAPTPRTGISTEQLSERKVRPPSFFDADKVPPDDAPIEDVIDYWRRWSDNRPRNLQPSETIKKRLLDATIDDPTNLLDLLSVLPNDDAATAKLKKLWMRGDDLRIFLERPETDQERQDRYGSDDEEDDELTRTERRRRVLATYNSRFTWRALENGRAGEIRSQPDGYFTFDESRFPLDHDEEASGHNRREVQQLTDDSIVMTRNFDGVWRQEAGQKPVRIADGKGAYANPVVTPDGKWLVLAKTDGDWGGPNYVVRLNLQSRREFRVNLLPADDFSPVVYLSHHGKVLLRRAQDLYPGKEKSVGPDSPEYYLLDAGTGETQQVTGNFAPLLQEGKRFLQSSAKPDQFWAAIPNEQKTQIGRYNLKDFTFQPLLTLPDIEFDSMQMWIDETEGQIYVVYQNQLLRLPLKQSK